MRVAKPDERARRASVAVENMLVVGCWEATEGRRLAVDGQLWKAVTTEQGVVKDCKTGLRRLG